MAREKTIVKGPRHPKNDSTKFVNTSNKSIRHVKQSLEATKVVAIGLTLDDQAGVWF